MIHHSAVTQPNIELAIKSFNENHKERLHPKPNWFGNHISYHYIIGVDGEIRHVRPLEEVGYHASNLKVNKESIWICFSWNFDEEKPTLKQYSACVKLINELEQKFWKLEIHQHNEYAKKSCPGKNFDFTKLKNTLMLFYENLRKQNIEKLPEDQRAVKDPKKAVERISKLSTTEMVSELIYFLSVVTQNTIKKENAS